MARHGRPRQAPQKNTQYLANQFKGELEAIRKAKEPVTYEELERWCGERSAERDATALLTKAFQQLTPVDTNSPSLPLIGRAEFPPVSEPFPPDMRLAIEQCLRANSNALESLHQDLKRNSCWFAVKLSDGLNAQLPHLVKFRNASRLLSLEASLAAQNNRPEAVHLALLSQLRLAQCLESEPLFISHLIRLSILGVAQTACERAIPQTQFSEVQLANLAQTFLRAQTAVSLARFVIADRVFGIEFFLSPPTTKVQQLNSTEGEWPLPLMIQYTSQPGFAEDFAAYLNVTQKLIDLNRLSLSAAVRKEPYVAAQIAALKKYDSKRPAATRIFSGMFLPALDTAFWRHVECIARLSNTRVALGIERYRLAHRNQLPDILADLAPAYLDAVPEDPYSGEPLRYRKSTEYSYLVYSIGQDGTDNGGRIRPFNETNRSGFDITFFVSHKPPTKAP